MDRPRFWRLANSQDWCHCAHFTFSEWDYFYQEFPFDYTIRNLFCTHKETDIFFSMNAFERRFCSVTKQARCQLLQSPRDGKIEISPEWNICKTWFGSKVVFACIFWGKIEFSFSLLSFVPGSNDQKIVAFFILKPIGFLFSSIGAIDAHRTFTQTSLLFLYFPENLLFQCSG